MATKSSFIRKVSLLFDREAGQRMEEETAASLARAGKEGNDALAAEMEKGGKVAAKALTKALTADFNRTMADARSKLAKGLIDPQQFAAIRREADRTFNRGLVAGMEEFRKSGKLTEEELQVLSRRIRIVGQESEKVTSRMADGFKRLVGPVVALFAVDRIRRWGQEAVGAFLSALESVQRLNAMVEANGGAVQMSGRQLRDFAREVRDSTLLQQSEIELAISQLLTYQSISGETFKDTIRAASDIAAVFGGMTSATEALGRALDDPVNGLAMLAQRGFRFDESVKAQIKSLVEQNNLLGAQTLLLRALQDEQGGVAKAMREGPIDATKGLSDAWTDFKERMGEAIITMGQGEAGIRKLTEGVKWLTSHADDLVAVVLNLGKAIVLVAGVTVIGRFVTGVRTATTAVTLFSRSLAGLKVALGPVGWIAAGVTLATAIFQKSGQAARDAKRDIDEYVASLKTMSREELTHQLGELRRQSRENQAVVDDPKASERRKKIAADNVKQLKQYGQQIIGLIIEIDRAANGAVTVTPTVEIKPLVERIDKLRDLRDMGIATAAEIKELAKAEERLARLNQGGIKDVDDRILAQKTLNGIRREAIGITTDELAALSAHQELRDDEVEWLQHRRRELGLLLADEHTSNEMRLAAHRELATVDQALTQRQERQRDLHMDAIQFELYRLMYKQQLTAEDKVQIAQLWEELKVQEALAKTERDRIEVTQTQAVLIQEQLRHHSALLGAVGSVAEGFADAWSDAFERVATESFDTVDVLKFAGKQMGLALVGGLADYAKGKAKESIAAAISAAANGFAALALGPIGGQSAGAWFKSSAMHTAAASAWGAMGGAIGGAQSRLSGGSTSPVAANEAAQAEKPADQFIFYIHGFDPADPRHQNRLIEGLKNGARRDSSIDIRPWDGR